MNLNQTIICGRLGKEVEMRYTPNGAAVANFSLAVTSYIKKKDEEGYDDHTTWVDVTCWGKTAERVAEYAKKGTELLVSGRIDNRQWEDKETGKKQYRTFVTAVNVQVGEGRNKSGEVGSQEAPPDTGKKEASPDAPASPPPAEEEGDSDLPF